MNNSPPFLTALSVALRRGLMGVAYRFEVAAVAPARQVLIDVSVIVHNDARTGIQRVVRALVGQLAELELPDVVIQPVFASRDHGYCKAELMPDGRIVNVSPEKRVRQPVVTNHNDVFLGLDLCAHLLPHVEADLARWRRKGVSINIMVYDMLPILHEDWFPARTARNFRRWLGVLARQADRCICISQTVASALGPFLKAQDAGPMPEITTIPLGTDLAASYPSQGLPADFASVREWLRNHRVILSVGTIEPRKGHQQLLAALSRYWQSEPSGRIALLIVGRPGWKTAMLTQQLRDHPEQGRRLLWLEDASDELLSELYSDASGLAATSHGEGFGLPLLEALAHGTPVLARDLPVFREIGGTSFDYFTEDSPDPLLNRIKVWLASTRRPKEEIIAALPRWADSASALCNRLGILPDLSGRSDRP